MPEQLKEDLTPYVFESGLDIDLLNSDRKLIAQGLIMYSGYSQKVVQQGTFTWRTHPDFMSPFFRC